MKNSYLGICLIITSIAAFLFPASSFSKTSASHDKGVYVIENGKVRMEFSDGGKFSIKRFDFAGKNILPAGGSEIAPWVITYKGLNGENPELNPAFGEYEGVKVLNDGDSRSLIFSWGMHLDNTRLFPVRMEVTLGNEAEMPEWKISADLPEGWVVTKLEFPRITIARDSSDKVILPYGYGIEFKTSDVASYNSVYPSYSGGMQLVLMHNGDGTVFYSTRDKKACSKKFDIKCGKGKAIFSTETVASYAWSHDGEFSLPWNTVIGYNPGSWENTVEKWYRPFTFETEWGAKKISERNDITDWIKNADIWIRPKGTGDSTMVAVRKAIKYFGGTVGVHWYWWHKIPYDTHYPEYFPPRPDFKGFVAETQKLGGYVTPYINGRLWDPSTDSYKNKHGYEASCRKADGTLYSEIYGSKVINTVTCPASPIWQKVQKDLVDSIVFRLGTSGVYIDQIGAAASEPCYATNHGHAQGGGGWWPAAYRKLISEERATLPEGKALTTEENSECYIDLFDMMLTVNTSHGSGMKTVPLFPLVYSDRSIYCGYSYMPKNISDGSFRFISMRSLLWGAELGWIQPYRIMAPDASEEASFLKRLVEFRRGNHDIFVYGRFMGSVIPDGDNPVVDIPDYESSHVVMAALWSDEKGKASYVIVNMDEKPHIVRIENKEIKMAGLSCKRIRP